MGIALGLADKESQYTLFRKCVPREEQHFGIEENQYPI